MKVHLTSAAEILAFECRIMYGNHNNAMLIDRVIERANYQLAYLRSETFCKIQGIGQLYLEKENEGS